MRTQNGALALSAYDAADWKQAHAALSRLARERAALDAEEGRCLLRALRTAAHVHLGFASFLEYTERLFGYRPRTTQEKLRVAESLETLPCLARALETGGLSWCAVRELTRVAVAETEPAWLDAARGKTLRELEAATLDPVTMLRAANENAGLDAAPAEPNGDESSAICQSSDHAHVDAESRRESDAAVAPDATPPQRASSADVRSSRAKQSVPPALRRAVLARDRHRCTVPGCTHATFVDVHHVVPRSEGGRNEASNLSTLCSAHHRATHRGELLIDRERDGSLRFRHADGAAYGDPLSPQRIEAHAKVFSALRHLGFRESEVKTVLSELRTDAELGDASVEHLLHEALCRIRPTAR